MISPSNCKSDMQDTLFPSFHLSFIPIRYICHHLQSKISGVHGRDRRRCRTRSISWARRNRRSGADGRCPGRCTDCDRDDAAVGATARGNDCTTRRNNSTARRHARRHARRSAQRSARRGHSLDLEQSNATRSAVRTVNGAEQLALGRRDIDGHASVFGRTFSHAGRLRVGSGVRLASEKPASVGGATMDFVRLTGWAGVVLSVVVRADADGRRGGVRAARH